MQRSKVLVVDDEYMIRWSLEKGLKRLGYQVVTVSSAEEALNHLKTQVPDMMLIDIKLPGIDGLELLEKVKGIDEEIIVLMISAMSDLKTAIEAMKKGAFHYILKPFTLDEILIHIQQGLETLHLKREVAHLRFTSTPVEGATSLIGNSPQIQNTRKLIHKIANSDATTVLIEGESGTGKELVARAIHFESSRAGKPFMAINCAAVPAPLLESELMGHEKGAFTDAINQKKGLFELANGGTVFLDEIGDMEPGMQAKLLRVLEERSFRRVGGTHDIQVDVRIISATNKNLLQAIEDGTFRTDLYYRLQVIPVPLAPLRERKEDILPLTKHFIDYFNGKSGKKVRGVSKQAEKMLQDYPWPGNVRELKNVIERALILENEERLTLHHLPQYGANQATKGKERVNFSLPPEGINIEDVERELIRQALEMADGNQSQAARKLHLGIDAFRYRMKKYHFL